jgi:hypothetical protein
VAEALDLQLAIAWSFMPGLNNKILSEGKCTRRMITRGFKLYTRDGSVICKVIECFR